MRFYQRPRTEAVKFGCEAIPVGGDIIPFSAKSGPLQGFRNFRQPARSESELMVRLPTRGAEQPVCDTCESRRRCRADSRISITAGNVAKVVNDGRDS